MTRWLLLENPQVSAEDTVAAIRAALPLPWGSAVIVSATQQWRPLSMRIPAHYRAERRQALREIWTEQAESGRSRLEQLTALLRPEVEVVDTRFTWGDPVAEAHRLARALRAGMIIFPVPAGRELLTRWPRSVARRLAQDAPCSVLLARAANRRTQTVEQPIAAAA